MADPLGDPFDEDWFNTQQDILKEAWDEAKNAKPKSMNCINEDYDGALAVDNSWMLKLANKFCEEDLSKEISKNMTSDDIDSGSYDGYSVEFSYKPGDDDSVCIMDCADSLETLTAKCELSLPKLFMRHISCQKLILLKHFRRGIK